MKTFISHSSQDKWFADRIVALLDQLGANVWYDKIDLFIGDNLVKKIYQGLEECTHLIVILSGNSIKSKWVQEELETFYQDIVENDKTKIYPFLLEDVWDDAPKFLKKYVYADFRNSSAAALNPAGVAEVEKEFRGLTVFEGGILKCYRVPENHRILVTLPQGKTKKQINEEAIHELKKMKPLLVRADVVITGIITYTLAMMIGAHLGNTCKSLRAYDPKGENEHEFVPIFLPS